MREVDPRVGISIDSGSASCASDLSDSEGTWGDEPCAEDLLRSAPLGGPSQPEVDQLLKPPMFLNLDCGSWSLQTSEVGVIRDLPRSPSFRSRMHRRSEDDGIEEDTSHSMRRTRNETANSWDDNVRIARHPRAPSLRFCLTLCTLTLVLLSLASSSSTGGGGERSAARESDILPEELRHRSHQDRNAVPAQKLLRTDLLAKYYLPDENQIHSEDARDIQPKDIINYTTQSNRKVSATRSNLAMARLAERRPVFGEAAGPHTARFAMDNAPPSKVASDLGSFSEGSTYPSVGSNWTSWFAAVALIAMLIETGYKEYRQCRMDDFFEEHRRL